MLRAGIEPALQGLRADLPRIRRRLGRARVSWRTFADCRTGRRGTWVGARVRAADAVRREAPTLGGQLQRRPSVGQRPTRRSRDVRRDRFGSGQNFRRPRRVRVPGAKR